MCIASGASCSPVKKCSLASGENLSENAAPFTSSGAVLTSRARAFRVGLRRRAKVKSAALLIPTKFVAPASLIFYGLALVNASKYTLTDIRYLGYCEIALGILNMQWPGHGLYFWAIGFGFLHIVYGIIMWWKYERHSPVDSQ